MRSEKEVTATLEETELGKSTTKTEQNHQSNTNKCPYFSQTTMNTHIHEVINAKYQSFGTVPLQAEQRLFRAQGSSKAPHNFLSRV